MKIVVTDGFTLNPGDLSWNRISTLGEVQVFDRTASNEIVERCKDANVVVTNKTSLDKETIGQLKNLKLISVTATGYNIIDVAAAKEKGIIVANVPAYGTASVAQHVFALLLELTNRVGVHAQSVAAGEWVSSIDWSYTKTPIMELSGKTMGLVGLGNIGTQTAVIAKAFGMNVLYYTPRGKPSDVGQAVDLGTLFSKSDVVSLHCPLTGENKEFVNKKLLSQMKRSAFFINTARGLLVNEPDLADALNENKLTGAGLDVLSTEPPQANNPLLSAKNCIITPHNAWISKEARERIMDVTFKNVAAFFDGEPINVVN